MLYTNTKTLYFFKGGTTREKGGFAMLIAPGGLLSIEFMKILAIDTSTLVMGVAVLEDNRVLGERITNSHKKHSVRLMPAIDQMLKELELDLHQIDLLAVTKGPGSYTGIRIGVTTVKTLAWVNRIPFYGISTLSVLARNGFYFDGLVVPLLDARRERVYTGVYQRVNDQLKEIISPQVVPLIKLLNELKTKNFPILFLGDDSEKFSEQIKTKLAHQASFGVSPENIPKPSQLGYLAYCKWLAREKPEKEDFTPDYLQLTQAEMNWFNQQKMVARKNEN